MPLIQETEEGIGRETNLGRQAGKVMLHPKKCVSKGELLVIVGRNLWIGGKRGDDIYKGG